MTSVENTTNMDLVTKIDNLADPDQAVVAEAFRSAQLAASMSGVRVEEICDLAHLKDVERLFDLIWRPDPKSSPMSTEVLRAVSKAGNYIGAAFEGDRLIGACVGFFGPPAEGTIHSHIAGVLPTTRGRSVGYAIKLHQRAWALASAVTNISWTFDPLVARNAYFNLVKLGAQPVEYLPNFYGGTNDRINGDSETDRLLVQWDLNAPAVLGACSGIPVNTPEPAHISGATIALDRSETGRPMRGPGGGSTVLVATANDIETVRTTDPELAKEWRLAMREVLGGLLEDGYSIIGFHRAGWYSLSRKERAR